MSLRDRMRSTGSGSRERRLYERYGVIENPFPAAGQPSDHPRMEDEVDDAIERRFRQFETDNRPSQVFIVEGTQGVGKTNLLNYYEEQFRDYYKEDKSFIIRYYPDPEPTFDSLLKKVFQSFEQLHFENIGRKLAESDGDTRSQAKEIARSHDVKIVLNSLEKAGKTDDGLQECARLASEWFLGLRILKQHREILGVSFRLDTVESRTQALRDVIYVSEKLQLLKGILLLLDELEKQDYSLSKTPVLRFLLSIRALIDTLPRCLFLMLAMTPQARLRYFTMLPALAGRLQDVVTLLPMTQSTEAIPLVNFYSAYARSSARSSIEAKNTEQGSDELFASDELIGIFQELKESSADRGINGVTPRDFLHRLHMEWEEKIRN